MKAPSPASPLLEVAAKIRPSREAVLVAGVFFLTSAVVLILAALLLRNAFLFAAHERAEDFALRAAHSINPEQYRALAKPGGEATPVSDLLAEKLRAVLGDDPAIKRVRAFSLEEQEAAATHEPSRDPTGTPTDSALRERIKTGLHLVRFGLPDAYFTPGYLTGYAPVRDAAGNITGVIAVDMDLSRLRDRVRVLVLSCAGALALLGIGAIGIGRHVHRVRHSAVITTRELARAREIEELAIEGLGQILYERHEHDPGILWRGNSDLTLGIPCARIPATLPTWQEMIHPEDRAVVRSALAQADRSGEPLELEYRVRHSSGIYRWVFDRAVLTGDDGHRSWVGILIDVTTRREAIAAVREFVEQNPTPHVAFAGDELIDANPAAVRTFRAVSRDDLLETPLWKLWPRRQPDQALSAEAWSEHVHVALTNAVDHFEWLFVATDGTELAMDVFLNQATFGHRKVLLMACYDLSAVRRAQEQLILSEQRFRDVSAAVGEFIWEVDAEGRYTFVSSRVRDVLGLSETEVIGHHPFEWVPAEDAPSIKDQSLAITTDRKPFRNFEHRIRRADGQILWISASGLPRFDADGNCIGYRGASLDITQRRDYEQELVLQKEAAEAAGLAKSAFLAMMSHEIRTPLNSVLGFADLILQTPLNDRQREYLDTIQRSGDALLLLLNDILDFSKIESGRMAIDPRATDLRRSITDVVELYRPACDAKQLTIRCAFDPAATPFLRTDPARLRQILINLVGNAVKFTAAGHVEIHLAPHRADGWEFLRFAVTDTGIGLTPEQAARLFQPFSQADSSTTRQFGGTGLGLAISKRLAHLLGGEIGILSTSPAGTTFVLDLPLIRPDADELAALQPAKLPSPDSAPTSGGPLRILVVDDNTINCRLATQMLELIGDTAEFATSAADCFRAMERSDFDVILMDVQMPEMDGLEATELIRENERVNGSPPVPIIALTAGAMADDREACLRAGMNEYLTKPVRRDDLTRVLNKFRPAS